MKKLLAALLSAAISTCAFSGLARSQSAPHAVPTARFSRRSKQRFSETVKGRIVKLDVNAGTFSVQIGATNRVIDLEAADGVRLTRLRRGERVIVTYSGSVATKVEATRSEK